jgi:3-hydroxy-9,10-secoandrosta-1,3,5(10)-triene-9,17-dione monooxygenase
MIPSPEPGLTAQELVRRAAALRPALRDRQAETERLTCYPPETHQDFLKAGFYRTLQPRRYGGYEFGLPVFTRVVTEIARGCPSTGWALSLASAHALQVGSVFDEAAQDEIFGDDGEFRAASTVAPIGVARPDGDGHYLLDGTWPYSSGSPWSTHYLGQTMLESGEMLLFVAPPGTWHTLDDWYGTLGLRGSGSNSVRIDNARIPERLTRRVSMMDLPVAGGTPGSRLHGNPMYAGRALAFFAAELASIMVGTAYAAADEYARIARDRTLVADPSRTRAENPDHQRYLGQALAAIATAETALTGAAQEYMEACRRNCAPADDPQAQPFDQAVDDRLSAVFVTAARMAWDALQGTLFRTAGSRYARDGERMQRYFRDAATYWTHFGATIADPLAQRVGCAALGLPADHIPLTV